LISCKRGGIIRVEKWVKKSAFKYHFQLPNQPSSSSTVNTHFNHYNNIFLLSTVRTNLPPPTSTSPSSNNASFLFKLLIGASNFQQQLRQLSLNSSTLAPSAITIVSKQQPWAILTALPLFHFNHGRVARLSTMSSRGLHQRLNNAAYHR